ncbi:DUF4912 domain-containing protein [Planktothrix pseudagardhii]|uniref:DUF4912 domain-containing protein n=1 Tax=Planktothrix pseudagardhii TaxID=132604 RepID=A0A9W4CUQ2_9CYAN|nr:DUF4912 domain-containing protein [Planktothrix pseudagardhii]CAD5975667.1 hypothetical protein NO713_04148 [Planktothrix pseudagardhii]
MLLNKKDTSIVTLTLLLSIATSPVAWAASRWPSNTSVADSTTLSESSLLSSKQVRKLNIERQPLSSQDEWDVKLKPMSKSEVALSSQQPILLSQLDSSPLPPRTKKNSVVSQSSQVQQATVPATEGEIPSWLWWLLPMIPVLGFWLGLQFKTQRSKSGDKQSKESITPVLSTESDISRKQHQTPSSPVLVGGMELNESTTESLKTSFSPIVSSVSTPRTVLKKHNQTEKEFASMEDRAIQQVAEAVLIAEIDESEAEAVIAEFLTTKAPIEKLTESELLVSPILETEPNIPTEPAIVESDIEEEPSIIATVGEELIEPELSVFEIVETEPNIPTESTIVESDIEEEPPIIATVDEELIEPELSVFEIVETEPNIPTESTIVKSDIEEEPPIIATVDEELIEPELSVFEIVETESDIPTEPAIVESDIEEEPPTIATVDEDLIKPELSVSPILETEPNIATESDIVESDIEEELPTIATVDEDLIKPELSVSPILETEPNIATESDIVESDIEEELPTIATVDEDLIKPELSVSPILETEPNIATESDIVESDIEEELPTIATVDEDLVKPELLIPKLLETEPNIATEPAIVEPDIEEEPPTIATVDEELIEPELSVSELAKTEPEEIELGVAHQDVRSEADVAATKFNLGKEITFEPSLADVDQGLPALPDGYGQSQIFLLPRDPNWAYAYWDIPNEHKEYLRQQGGIYLLLRVYDVTAIDMDTQPPLSMQEYECDEITREWYIPISMSDRDYIAELGYLTRDGRWLVLVRSNHIRIPPIYPTDWENDQFINVPWNKDLRGKTQFRL